MLEASFFGFSFLSIRVIIRLTRGGCMFNARLDRSVYDALMRAMGKLSHCFSDGDTPYHTPRRPMGVEQL